MYNPPKIFPVVMTVANYAKGEMEAESTLVRARVFVCVCAYRVTVMQIVSLCVAEVNA